MRDYYKSFITEGDGWETIIKRIVTEGDGRGDYSKTYHNGGGDYSKRFITESDGLETIIQVL